MTIPTITVLPTAPARTDTPAVFNTRADAFLGALYSPFSDQMNASITAINTDVGGIDAAVIAAQLAETNAETAETNAELAETNAGNSATAAGTSAANALTSENAAATTYDNFDDRYLGAFAADPTTDNDGGALLTGAQYFNTASDVTRVYNGSSWQDSAALATSVTVSQISDYTGTAAELNYTDGVTSAIQTQLDSKNALPILKGVSYTAVAGEFVTATAGSITITLPASPSVGDTVTVKDGTGAAATTTFTVGRNSSNIASSATDLVFDKNFAEITMTYIDGTMGWSV